MSEPIEPQAENALEESPKKSRSGSRLVIVLVLVAIGGGTFWLYSRRHSAQAQPAPDATADAPVKSVMPLESFTVNLADPEQTAFLRITINLGVTEAAPEGKSSEKNSPVLPKVRDAILTVLTTWQSAALLAPDGKTKLKQQILNALQGQVPEVPVKEIYFTEFLVQR